MGKYSGLERVLVNSGMEEIKLTISDIEIAIGDKLPESAHSHEEWWGNDKTHVQARAWMTAGYRVVDIAEPLHSGTATFSRR
jgi:hypothetical protein